MTEVLARVKAVLASTATRWLNMTEVLPVDLLNHPPAAGAWSATACLIHLLDTEHIFPARVRALLAGQAIPAFDPGTQGTKNTPLSPEKLATEFASLRQSSLAVLERVAPQDFNCTAEHSELGTVTLSQLLHEWAAHDLNHTIQADLSERRFSMSETSLPLFARRYPGGGQPEPIERLPGTLPRGCRLFQSAEPSRISSCREP